MIPFKYLSKSWLDAIYFFHMQCFSSNALWSIAISLSHQIWHQWFLSLHTTLSPFLNGVVLLSSGLEVVILVAIFSSCLGFMLALRKASICSWLSLLLGGSLRFSLTFWPKVLVSGFDAFVGEEEDMVTSGQTTLNTRKWMRRPEWNVKCRAAAQNVKAVVWLFP